MSTAQLNLTVPNGSSNFNFLVNSCNVLSLLNNGNVGIGTISQPPTINSSLNIYSTNQLSARITLTGQEYYQANNLNSDGIALLLGINRVGNGTGRQLWICDSSNLGISGKVSQAFVYGTNGGNNTPFIDVFDANTVARLGFGIGASIFSTSSGYIGIGITNSITYNLTVNGTIGILNNNMYIGTGTYIGANMSLTSANNDMVSLTNSTAAANANIKFINNATSNAYIGIGGTSTATLNSSYSNNLFLHSGCNIILNAGNNSIATTPHLFLSNNGFIGIGTSSSIYNLNINGSLNLTSLYQGGTLINFSTYLTTASASSTYQQKLTFTTPLTNTANTVSIDLSSYDTIAQRNTALGSYLPLNGGIMTGQTQLSTASGNNPLYISSTSTSANNCIQIKNNSTYTAYIGIGGTNFGGNYANNLFIESSLSSIIFNTNGRISTSTPNMIIDNNGNVGIGTNSTSFKLDINATGGASGTGLRVYDYASANSGYVALNAGTNSLPYCGFISFYQPGTEQPRAGYIGWGTSYNSANYLLLQTEVSFAGYYVTSNLVVNNNLTVNSTGTTSLNGLVNINSNLTLNNINNDILTINNSSTFGTATANIKFNNNLNCNAIIGIGGANNTFYNNNFFIQAQSNIIFNANNNNNNPHLFISTSGNIGIGTSTNLTNNLTINTGLNVINGTTTLNYTNNNVLSLTNSSSFTDVNIKLTNSTNWNAYIGVGGENSSILNSYYEDQLFIESESGILIYSDTYYTGYDKTIPNMYITRSFWGLPYIGINNVSPVCVLDIKGMTRVYDDGQSRFLMGNRTGNCSIELNDIPGSIWQIQTMNTCLYFYSDGNFLGTAYYPRMYIDSNAYLYIGTNANLRIGGDDPNNTIYSPLLSNIGIKLNYAQNPNGSINLGMNGGNGNILSVTNNNISITRPLIAISSNNDIISLSNSSQFSNVNIKFTNNATSNAFIGIGGTNSSYLNSSYQNNFFIHSGCNIILNAGSNINSTNPHLYINNTGNVGIGTTIPNTKLEVNGCIYTSSANAAIPATGSFGGQGDRIILWKGLTGYYPYSIGIEANTLWISSPFQTKFYNNGSNTFIIDTNCNIGIGISTPQYKLDVNGNILCRNGNNNTIFTNNQLLFGWNGNNQYMHSIKSRHNGNNGGDNTNAIDIYIWKYSADTTNITTPASSQIMSITGFGVGIGTTNPSGKLHIYETTGTSDMVSLSNSAANANTNIKFINNATSNAFIGIGGTSTATLNSSYSNNFFIHSGCNIILNAGSNSTATNPHLFLSNIGNIGIGISTPLYKLDINGNSRVYNGSGTTDFYIGNGSATAALNFWDVGGAAWRIYTTLGDLLFTNGTTNGSMVERIRINSSGYVSIGSNIFPGSSSVINVNSSTSIPRITLTGKESYQNFTSSDGIALIIGVNRTTNRQLWIGDSAQLASSAVSNIVRIIPGYGGLASTIDGNATTGINATALNIGSAGALTTLLGTAIYCANNVGIGTATANAKLEVASGTASTGAIQQYIHTNSTGITSTTTASTDVCAIFNSSIWCKTKVTVSSDIRIKNNINDINDDSALQKILNIQPKTYNYIDNIERGSNIIYGFIAQQIKEIIPEAITLTSEFIPNIYSLCSNNSNTIIIPEIILSNNNINININDEINIIDGDNYERNNYIITNINSNQITINKNLNCSNCFVYGTKVNDFHTLNKEYIYTLNVCATQDLYKMIQEQKILIDNLYEILRRNNIN